jgi:hypothetical protein
MDPIPLLHVVVAVASNFAGELTVSPFSGLVTITLANAGAAMKTSARRAWEETLIESTPQTICSEKFADPMEQT